ncbi:MAG: SRPBCC domain-containing protein, partial [Bacteroidota bacterium]|nr:SRPBCC domain-containing protein [Bacteroidota bacterium]
MKTIQYKKEIQAPATKVYRTMLGLDNIKTYENWTAAFDPSSTYEGSWDKGSKIYFVGTDQEGNRGG